MRFPRLMLRTAALYHNEFEYCLQYSRANMNKDDTEITILSNSQAELIETA